MLDLICNRRAWRMSHAPSGFLVLALGAALLLAPEVFAAEAPATPILSPPFDHYQRWRDEPLLDWREANDRVGAIGGWRTYLRESQEGSSAAATSQPTEKPTEKLIDKPSDKPGDPPSGSHSQHGQ